MTKYIKISNRSDNVSRIALEKLGLSTKRNDPDSIGQFGSGIKYAPIAALRKGLEWIFTGYDNKGAYTLKYKVEQEDGIDCIVYDYGDYKKASSFTIDAGVLSWENSFQIYREAVANAIDEANLTDTSWTKEIVDEKDIAPELGVFSVYITASPALMDIFNHHNKYFLNEREYIYSNGSGYRSFNIYNAYDSEFYVYSKSVLVHSDEEVSCIFNYELQAVRLNEMRTVADEWQMNYMISNGIAECDDRKVIAKYIRSSLLGEDVHEWSLSASLISSADVSNTWCDVWHDLYGDNCIMLSTQESLSASIIHFVKEKGMKYQIQPVEFMYELLKKANVATLESIAGEAVNYDIDTEIEKYPKLIKAIEIAARFDSGIAKERHNIACFISKQTDVVLGLTINNGAAGKQMLIEKNHITNAPIEEIVGTLIHEYDHYSTGYQDGNFEGRKFRDLADRRIGKLMCEFYRQTLIQHTEGGIHIPLESLSELGSVSYKISWCDPLNCFIMSLGKKAYKIYSSEDIAIESTAVPVENGTKFFIAIPGFFTFNLID